MPSHAAVVVVVVVLGCFYFISDVRECRCIHGCGTVVPLLTLNNSVDTHCNFPSISSCKFRREANHEKKKLY